MPTLPELLRAREAGLSGAAPRLRAAIRSAQMFRAWRERAEMARMKAHIVMLLHSAVTGA